MFVQWVEQSFENLVQMQFDIAIYILRVIVHLNSIVWLVNGVEPFAVQAKLPVSVHFRKLRLRFPVRTDSGTALQDHSDNVRTAIRVNFPILCRNGFVAETEIIKVDFKFQ